MTERERTWGLAEPTPFRRVVATVAGPATVTAIGLVSGQRHEALIAVLFVLAVAIAAASGGTVAGVVASFLSFLSFNFFFTPPLHTFTVAAKDDLAALLVFLAVSLIVGLLLSAAVTQKNRAERREIETRLINQLTTRLLGGDDVDSVLRAFATGICQHLSCSGCEITTAFGAVTQGSAIDPDNAYLVELSIKGRSLGTMSAAGASPQEMPEDETRRVLDSLGRQLALALEAMRLSNEVRRVESEAEASRLKADLFAGVTHDVKTPLGAITTSVTSLIDSEGFSEADQQDHLETIRQEAERLNRVINNLLDLARARSGALVPKKVASPIDELMESVVSRIQPMFDGQEIEIRAPDSLPEVEMDLVQMDQVLTNLLENAIKFSPQGSVVALSAVGGAGSVRVTVADRGPGIPEGDRERLFLPFETGGEPNSGTGLGLAIARAIVVAHGGRIWAARAPGGGAAITFELPSSVEQ